MCVPFSFRKSFSCGNIPSGALPASGSGPPSYRFQACDHPLTAVCVSALSSHACTDWVSLKLLSDHAFLGGKTFQELSRISQFKFKCLSLAFKPASMAPPYPASFISSCFLTHTLFSRHVCLLCVLQTCHPCSVVSAR